MSEVKVSIDLDTIELDIDSIFKIISNSYWDSKFDFADLENLIKRIDTQLLDNYASTGRLAEYFVLQCTGYAKMAEELK